MFKVSIIFILAMATYFIGTYHSKRYADTMEMKYAVYASIEFLFTTITWLMILTQVNKLAIIGAIWSICCCFITILLAFMVFNETMTTTQIVGLMFGVVAIVLMSI
jgi:uncharacterized membrane protein